MRPATATSKLLAVFIVAFLCLNAGAFFCLGYCEIGVAPAAAHCPLKTPGAPHCPLSQATAKKNTDESDSVSGSALTCFMLPVGVVGAPLEAKAGIITAVPLTQAVEKIDFAPVVVFASRQNPKFYYRPPPNDTRLDRVRHQVFRI